MGPIIEQLGYKLVWIAGSCKRHSFKGRAIRLKVRNGCPEVVESEAVALISNLEEHKLKQVEELRTNTEEGKDRIRQARSTMHKSWWHHLVDYVRDSDPATGSLAVAQAPFFSEVPEQALQGILPPDGADVDPLWDALTVALPHLNRRRRKALHKSRSWIVHLFAGPGSHKSFATLEHDGAVVLELDTCRSSSQNLYRDPLWALLVQVARLGRVSTIWEDLRVALCPC